MAERAFAPYRLAQNLLLPQPVVSCRVQFSPDGALLAVGSNNSVFTYLLTPVNELVFFHELQCNVTRIIDLSFSPDSRFLAISTIDFTICIWDVVSTRSLVRTLTGHGNNVSCVMYSPKSMMIASGSFDETIRIWDGNSGECLMVIAAGLGAIGTLDFSPDGSMIVAYGGSGGCKIWDTTTGNTKFTIKEQGRPLVGSVKFSSCGKLVLIGLVDSSLRIWSMDHGILPATYGGHQNTRFGILSTFIRANERYIVSGSEDNCLYIWDVISQKLVQRINQAHVGPVLYVASHPTRNVIASVSLRDIEIVKIWAQNPELATERI